MDDRYFRSAFVYLSFNILSFYAFFPLKFRPILTKDFKCLNSDSLIRQNCSFEVFSVTDKRASKKYTLHNEELEVVVKAKYFGVTISKDLN